jgi:O-antigen ligase
MPGFFLSLLIILTPLTHLSIMPKEMMGIPGNNPVNFIFIMAFVLVYTQSGTSHKPISRYFRPAFIALWTVIDVKSLHPTLQSQQLSSGIAFGTLIFKQTQIIITGLMVYKYCLINGAKQIEKATSLMPVIILPFLSYYFFLGSAGGVDYRMGRELLSNNMGLNANEIGGLGVAVLAYNLGKTKEQFTKLDLVSISSSLLVIVFTLSRMAFIATLLIFLFTLKKLTLKQKITSISLLVIVIMAFTPLLLSRINYGISDRSDAKSVHKEVNANELSAGRVDYVWIPSLHMIEEHPVLGDGLLSIWKGEYLVPIKIMKPSHPHNAYLQIALDMGLVGILILIFFLKSMWTTAKHNTGFIYAFITWLLMGLTGSTFYPELYTFPIWIYYAITCAKPHDKPLASATLN